MSACIWATTASPVATTVMWHSSCSSYCKHDGMSCIRCKLWNLIYPDNVCKTKYHISRPITRALSIQKRCKTVKNEHARYTLERFPTDNTRVICTKKGIGKYGIMY
jgi:hypothetical protein